MALTVLLFSFYSLAYAQDSLGRKGDLSYDQYQRFQQVLELQHLKSPLSLLPISSTDPVEWWIEGYALFTELIFKEQPVYYPTASELLDTYFRLLDEKNLGHSWSEYMKAENRLQSAVLHLRYGSYWSAAWDFRKAFRYSEKSYKQNSDFSGNQKLRGTLLCIVGMVPSNYQWISRIAGMKGDFNQGIKLLSTIPPNDIFYKEALLLRKVLSEQSGKKEVQLSAEEHERITLMEDNKIAKLILIRQAMQQHSDTIAIRLIEGITPAEYASLPLLYYLRAELFLRAGYYGNARPNYMSYLAACPTCDLSKDATYKAALCAGLAGNTLRYKEELSKVQSVGKTLTVADQYAQHASKKVLNTTELDMLTLRFSLDGGYIERANMIIPIIDTSNIIIALELDYRKARLKELEESPDSAYLLYEKVALNSPIKGYYFGPNACLKLMEYAVKNNQPENVKIWYQRLKRFKKYPYSQSITDKAEDIYYSRFNR